MLDSKHTKIIGGSLGGLIVCVAAVFCFSNDTVETQDQVASNTRIVRSTAETDTGRIARPIIEKREPTTRVVRIREPHRNGGRRLPRNHKHKPKRVIQEQLKPAA